MIAKHFVFVALVGAAVLSATGCGGSGKKAEPTRTGPVVSLAPVDPVKAGTDFVATLRISNVQNLGGYQFTLDYDASKVSVVSQEAAPFLGSTGRLPICQDRTSPGALLYACATKEPVASQGAPTQTAPTAGPSGGGDLLTIHLHAADGVSGTIELQLAGVKVVDPLAADIIATSSGTSVKIQ